MALTHADSATLRTALDHYRGRRLAEAAELLDVLLARDPNQPQALLLLGVIKADGNDPGTAETLLQRYLTLRPGDPAALHTLGRLRQRRGDDKGAIALFEAAAARPGFAPPLNDLGASLHRLGRREEALAALDRAIAIDARYGAAHCNRGIILAELGRSEEATAAFESVLTIVPDSAAAWHNRAIASERLERLDLAEDASRQAIATDPAHLESYVHLARILERLHRGGEAQQSRNDWARRQGLLVKPSMAVPDARVLLIGGAAPCNVPTDFVLDRQHVEVAVLHLRTDAQDGAALASSLSGIDLIFNALGDADGAAPFLAEATALCRLLDRPLINPPDRIAPTRRDLLPDLLKDISGLVIPKIERLSRGDLDNLTPLRRRWKPPFLIRPAGSHGGADLRRIDRDEDLAGYLEAVPAPDYYVSAFCDYRSIDGLFRKYRFIFVDREVFPYHLAIGHDWLVHYWRAEMDRFAELRQEEERFLTDYHAVFAGRAAAVVEEIAHRLDLDYAGMDCALTGDGQVLLFEANASMLVHLDDVGDAFAYKRAHVPKIAEAMTRLVRRRLKDQSSV